MLQRVHPLFHQYKCPVKLRLSLLVCHDTSIFYESMKTLWMIQNDKVKDFTHNNIKSFRSSEKKREDQETVCHCHIYHYLKMERIGIWLHRRSEKTCLSLPKRLKSQILIDNLQNRYSKNSRNEPALTRESRIEGENYGESM